MAPKDPKATGLTKDLESRVAALENYFKVGLAVATIMGISGGFVGKTAYDALSTADKAMTAAHTAAQTVAKARDEAVTAVTEAGRTTVAKALHEQAPVAVKSEFDRLASRIRLSFGDEAYIDYRPLSGASFDHKCAPGAVAVGWGYGHRNNDARFFCRPVQVTTAP